MLEHGEGTLSLNLSQFTVLVELSVGHSHFDLVKLGGVRPTICVRSKLSRWRSACDFPQNQKVSFLPKVMQKCLNISLVDTANRVDICCATVILSQVAS